MNKSNNFVSAVVYVNNCEKRIEGFLHSITNELEKHFDHFEIICVNDFSTDDTVKLIKKYAKKVKNGNITLLNMSFHQGLELSMNAGVDLAIGDFVYEFDTTIIDYDCDLIFDVFNRLLDGNDIVSVSSNKKQKLSSKIFYNLFDKFSNSPIHMKSETFRLLSRRAINRIKGMNKSIPYRKAVYLNSGLNTINITYNHINNVSYQAEDSKYRINLAIDSLAIFTDFGYKVSLCMITFMLAVIVLVGVYTIVIYLKGIPVAGWTTTIMFMAVGFFGLFFVLGIVMKYLQILIDLSFKKVQYTFESIEKLTK